MMRRRLAWAVAWALTWTASYQVAWADGMFIPRPSQTLVDMEAQRGIIWMHEDGSADVYVQSRYGGANDTFAWVIPLPSRPVVNEASVDLLDALDEITAPRFYQEACYVACREGNHDDYPAGDAGSTTERPDSTVTEWESGEVGMLDYSVVSAEDGGDLGEWLRENDFAVPQGIEPVLAAYVDEGAFFFAARVRPGADTSEGITPVRFTLAALDEPMFPMRITALSPTAAVRVALWVIGDRQYAPRAYPFEQVEGSRMTVEEYGAEVERLTTLSDGRTFVAQFSRTLSYEDMDIAGYDHGDATEAIQELYDGQSVISRFVANLPPQGMTHDVVFEPVELSVHDSFTIPCPHAIVYEECLGEQLIFGTGGSACSVGQGGTGSSATAAMVLVALGAIFVCLIRRKR